MKQTEGDFVAHQRLGSNPMWVRWAPHL